MKINHFLTAAIITVYCFNTFFIVFVGAQTPMVSYINVHAVLERRRQRAQEAVGPSTPPLPVPNPQQLDSSSPAVIP
jgi:hypothetical protein